MANWLWSITTIVIIILQTAGGLTGILSLKKGDGICMGLLIMKWYSLLIISAMTIPAGYIPILLIIEGSISIEKKKNCVCIEAKLRTDVGIGVA